MATAFYFLMREIKSFTRGNSCHKSSKAGEKMLQLRLYLRIHKVSRGIKHSIGIPDAQGAAPPRLHAKGTNDRQPRSLAKHCAEEPERGPNDGYGLIAEHPLDISGRS